MFRSTRPIVKRLLLSAAIVVCVASAPGTVAAHGDETPIGPPAADTTSSTDAGAAAVTPPEIPADAVRGGERVIVRTDLVNTTQFLQFRFQLIELGFADSLESAPGSFLVSIGSLSLDEAAARINTLDHVVEVVPSFGTTQVDATQQQPDVQLPAWWIVTAAAALVSLTLVVVARTVWK